MPRIDPLQLLNCLNVLLTPSGGIKSEQEVKRISSLMEKFSKKLVSKCVYLLILRSSDPSLLSKFMGLGGWNLIYTWLVHAVEAKNNPFLIELLEVILICPVDIERLKSNPMPKQIKALSRDATVHTRVKDLASDIVKHWLAIVKSTPSAAVATTAANETSTINETQVTNSNQKVRDDHEEKDHASADASAEEEENYVKSTSPSSSSTDQSDDSDVFVPYKKSPGRPGRPRKKPLPPIKEKKIQNREQKQPKLKSKLITSTDSKEDKLTSLKLKIGKKLNNTSESKAAKSYDEKTTEEKLKEKRRLREEKEKEKFARFKHEREKKDKSKDKSDVDHKSSKDKSAEDKFKGELSKLIPKPLDKLGRIPKLSSKDREKENSASNEKRKEDKKQLKVDDDNNKKLSKKDDKAVSGAKENDKEKDRDKDKEKEVKKDKKPVPPPPPKKPVSMSVEKRFPPGEAKPKTVKAYNSKFRLTGLEQDVIPKPQSRKSSTSSNSQSPSNAATVSSERSAVKRSPPKDVDEPVEKKLKSPDVSFTEEKSPISSRNKKPFLQESDSFMNAMEVALIEQKEHLRKRKKPLTKSDSDSKSEDSPVRKNSDVTSPVVRPESKESKPAFKFYKETLEGAGDEPMDTAEPIEPDRSSSEIVESHKIAVTDYTKPKSAEGLKSSLAIFRSKKHPKKSVKWKSEDELEAVQYFEVDATERTNVVRNFWEMQMMERTKERDMMMVRKIGDNDKMTVQTQWRPLAKIDVAAPATARGANSQEKNIQYARERTVTPALYYNKTMIPDTPSEPDPESHPVATPPVIPLDDISGSQDSVNDFSALKWPEPKSLTSDTADASAARGFLPGAAPPIFPPFPDGTFPPAFGQPFFPGGPMPPLPVPPSNWTPGNTDQTQAGSMPWGAPNVVPPPGMIGPPPFGMMGPFPPIPGAGFPPNMFPPPNMSPNMSADNNGSSTSDNQQYSNNTYPSTSSNSEGSSKRWNSDDRYQGKKDNWRNNHNDRGNRDKRGSGSWRGSGGGSSSTRLCRNHQKKGFCHVSGCRFYHPESWDA